ncbi:hypothetical protein GCM10011499_23840 [Pelagibacterium lentulum]|uniref:Uncharacterized protein n=1 Tax=Pelagibacterium lentulum TaxID=2029865 RepID=A0A916VYS5_9HYPH|nr:hypothetical protein GCM10011499_23840 [Pelagibacterium lentulum]
MSTIWNKIVENKHSRQVKAKDNNFNEIAEIVPPTLNLQYKVVKSSWSTVYFEAY